MEFDSPLLDKKIKSCTGKYYLRNSASWDLEDYANACLNIYINIYIFCLFCLMDIFLFYKRDRKYPFCQAIQCNIKLEESNADYKSKYCVGFFFNKIEIKTKQIKSEHKQGISEFSVVTSLTGISLNLILG